MAAIATGYLLACVGSTAFVFPAVEGMVYSMRQYGNEAQDEDNVFLVDVCHVVFIFFSLP